MSFVLTWDGAKHKYTVDIPDFDGGVCYTQAELDYILKQFSWEAVEADTDPRHIFDDEGICIRCGVDAEEWGMDCVEGLLVYWEGEVIRLKQNLRLAEIDIEDLQERNRHLINMAKGR